MSALAPISCPGRGSARSAGPQNRDPESQKVDDQMASWVPDRRERRCARWSGTRELQARRPASFSLLFLLVHAEHALRDQKAAEDVDRGEDQARRSRARAPRSGRHRSSPGGRRPRAARRRRSPKRSHWSPTSAACAAPASPTTPRSSRQRSPARRSRSGTRTDRPCRRSRRAWRRRSRRRQYRVAHHWRHGPDWMSAAAVFPRSCQHGSSPRAENSDRRDTRGSRHSVPSSRACGGGIGRGHARRFVQVLPLPIPPPQAGERAHRRRRTRAPTTLYAVTHAALFGAKFGWITAPSRVSAVALTISSSHLTASAFSFLSTRMSRNVERFLA